MAGLLPLPKEDVVESVIASHLSRVQKLIFGETGLFMRNLKKALGGELDLKGNMGTLTIMSLLFGASFSMFLAVWQPFVISLGVSMTFLGLLQSLWGWYGIVPSIFGPIGGWASDRLGRKLLIMLGGMLTLAALFTYFLAWMMGSYLILIPGAIAMGLGAISWAARDSAIAESVERERWGSAYSLIIFFGLMPGIFLPLTGGYIAERFGFGAVFLITVAIQGGYLAMAFFRLKETVRRSVKGVTSFFRELKCSLRRIFIRPRA
ncbi:MAG: MFS transporter [Candidatus Hodarchaeaceae archaeon]|nr:MFS transporter [Candidatus Hodarchaeaceae archaeon]